MQLDCRLTYKEHVAQCSSKASKVVASLTRVMMNATGPNSQTRKLLNNVVHSTIHYGSKVCSEAMAKSNLRRMVTSAQRMIIIRVISAYRTISILAAQVIAGIPPIDLLIRERADIYAELPNHETDK